MAIYHCTVKVFTRSKNHNAVAAAAYRSGTRLFDERNNETLDFTRKGGISHSEIMAPENAPDWVGDRETLWNKVEAGEKRKDARLAREIEVALPRELSEEDRLALVRRFISEEAVSRGMVADFAIHERDSSDGGGNPHAHILLCLRPITPDGFSAKKEREWNKTELVETWRERWAVCCNDALESAGESARVDHRSLEAQGIMREPTIHIGKEAFHADKRGLGAERLDRQPSIVERSLSPFEAQIEAQEHIALAMTPEAGQDWWERMSAYTQRVSDNVQEFYGWARSKVRSWVERTDGDAPEQRQVIGR